jgi:heme/copper-type cytochrome/quinol oxidase subunit 4
MMNDDEHLRHQSRPGGGFWKSRTGTVLIAFLAIAGFLLVYEHRVHIFAGDALLIILLAVCIGMHLFMHHGHGGHGDRDDGNDDSDRGGRP